MHFPYASNLLQHRFFPHAYRLKLILFKHFLKDSIVEGHFPHQKSDVELTVDFLTDIDETLGLQPLN